METMHFHIANTKLFYDNFVSHSGGPIPIPMNNLAPMRNCPGGAR